VAAAALRRTLTVPAALGVAGLALSLGVAAPARAAPAVAAARAVAARPDLQPLPAEWWFSSWDIQTRVWPLTQGAGVTVAILDSGVQASLPDLRGAVVPGGDTTGARTSGMTDDDYPDDGHGTQMAVLIAGQGLQSGPVGIAPAAKILPVRVGGLDVSAFGGTDATIAAGIRYAADHGAKVINMSVAGPTESASACHPVLQDAVAYALEHNVVVVAAAGNSAKAGNPPESPASCAGVLAVGAVSPDLTSFPDSERQPYVAVSAPGNDIGLLGMDGLYFPDRGGTSCSSAFVSGEAALVRSRYPSMPWYQVVQRIINTALPEGSPVPNDSFGYGIVRIAGAVNASTHQVAASAPNPVYAAFRQWLATPQGSQFTAAARQRPHPVRSSPVAARSSPAVAANSSSGGSAGLAAVIAAVVVVAAAGTALFIAAARRRHGRPAAADADDAVREEAP
jgi:membrane-anchored mycosin MYCP